ncbi:unnamed protein product [Ostreobium quekettii]|uniref:Lysosomal Pro-X carboxypeptidase n=1 Tax=Ostreobium quekettii TaxID=121088 RepID=A0A8S1J621_9CHLO|nr:unnamed protein product [Ostreobium quekettii]|eukprot:evm.model.scf_1780.1 EVM.evm.TU.scf_1780.1   scf_1780:3991-8831(+)
MAHAWQQGRRRPLHAEGALLCLVLALANAIKVDARPRPSGSSVLRGEVFSAEPRYWKGPEPITLCEEKYWNATLDHFAWDPPDGSATYSQRYFLCPSFWKASHDGEKGPIFVYLGNEADVTLYLNATGLMWEHAQDYGALLVFVEHRYYGNSVPSGGEGKKAKQYLTTEQALADYAEFISGLKCQLNATNSPVVGFGGSYGGMLAAWMRMKYPHVVDGVIAASAPIWSFLGEEPAYDTGAYYKIVTYAASPAAGCAESCVPNVRRAWDTMLEMFKTDEGRAAVKEAMGICDAVPMKGNAWNLINWAATPFSLFAEGSYPFPCNYLTNGGGSLPAYPMRVACNTFLSEPMNGTDLLAGIASAASLLYNSTGNLDCFDFLAGVNNASSVVDHLWNWQYCTEMFQPFGMDGVNDMFWDAPYNESETIKWCVNDIGALPRPLWATTEWGGRKIHTTSNIVFSNGEYDPWRGGGVTNHESDSVTVFTIAEAGHHVDLMFSRPEDTDAIKAARAIELTSISKWIAEARQSRRTPQGQQGHHRVAPEHSASMKDWEL